VIIGDQWIGFRKSLAHMGLRVRLRNPVSKHLDTGCHFLKSLEHKVLRLIPRSAVPLIKGEGGGAMFISVTSLEVWSSAKSQPRPAHHDEVMVGS